MENQFVNVTASILPGLVAVANRASMSVDTLLEKAGLTKEQIDDPKSQLSLAQFDKVLEVMKEASGDPALGLHHGLTLQLNSLQIVGTLLATASTLKQAFELYGKYKDLVSPHIAFSIEEKGRETHIIYLDRLERGNKAIYAEIALSSLLTISRALTNKDQFRVLEAHFKYPEPVYSEEYRRIFKAPVFFGQKNNKIIVPTSTLERPLLGALPETNRKTEAIAREQLNQIHQSQKVSRQIINYLEENLGQQAISIQDVADHLKMTPRTLQRRLKDEETSYVALREKVRFKFAKNYLRDESMNMDTIAALLGFSESTNFYHAFKRWSGVSPGEFRKRLKQEEQNLS